MLELKNLTKRYREGEKERVVLRDVSLTIPDGEIVVILGRSGSGKSTLLNLVSGMDAPTDGDVLFNNVAVNRLNERDRTLLRRREMGFIFQFFNLIPTLTVAENLLLPLELSGRTSPAERAVAMDRLADVGLADRSRSYPDRLSGGEQQRVAIARALVHNPSLILADEPTGNLDAETGRQVLELLATMLKSDTGGTPKTALIATHSSEVVRLADRVLTIRDGELEPRPKGTTE